MATMKPTPPKPGAGKRATQKIKIQAKLSVDPNQPTATQYANGSYYGEAYGPLTAKEKKAIQLNKKIKDVSKTKTGRRAASSAAAKAGAKNKMKAQGTKAVSGPTARAMQFKKKGM